MTTPTISPFTTPPSDLRDFEASLPMNLSSSRLRSTTMVGPRPSTFLDPTNLLSKEIAVVHPAVVEALAMAAEEADAADLVVDAEEEEEAVVVMATEEVVMVETEEEEEAVVVATEKVVEVETERRRRRRLQG